MKKKKKIFLKALIIILSLFFSRSYTYSEMRESTSLHEYKLPNHLKVILIPASADSQTATVLLTVKTGSLSEGKYLGTGISHFLEHLLFKGTEDNNETELARRVKSIGGYVNAMTSYTDTQYYINLPSKNIDKALEILSEMIMNTEFDTEEFEKEKDVILREMDMNEDNPGRVLAISFFQTHYFETLKAYPIIGMRDAFKSLNFDDVLDYYNRTYQPSNMILTVCGSFKNESTTKNIEELFGKKQNKHFILRDLSSIKRHVGEREKVIKKSNLFSTKIMMGYKSCSLDSQDLYPLDVAAEILSGGDSSRLRQKLLFKNIVSSINCYNYTPQYEGVFVINFDLPGNSEDKAMNIIQQEIDDLKDGKIDDLEIKRAIQRTSLSYATSMEKNSDKAFRYTDSYLLTGTLDFPKKYLQNLKAVKADDIARVAKKYFLKDNLTMVMMQPKIKEEKEEDHLKPSENPAKETKPDLVLLPNGIRLILKKDENSLVSHLHIYFRGGTSYEKQDLEGLSQITAAMLRKGTSRLDQKSLAEKVELTGSSLGTFSGYNALGVKITVLNKNLEEAVMLIRDILTDSTFPEEEFMNVKALTKETIKKQKENILTFSVLKMRNKIFPGHPYGRSIYGTVESVENLSLEQAKRLWKDLFKSENMVIALSGNFNKEKTLSLLKKNFESIVKEPLTLPLQAKTFSPEYGEHHISYDSKQAAVLIGFKAPGYLSEEKYIYRFLDTFFSDQSSPIFESIRTQEGLAYMTGSVYFNGPYGGLFFFYCATSPENAKKVEELLISDIKKFQRNGMTKEDFQTTFERFISENRFHLETLSARTEASIFDEIYGLGYDNYLHFDDHAEKLNLEKLNSALRNNFDVEKSVILFVAPGEEGAL